MLSSVNTKNNLYILGLLSILIILASCFVFFVIKEQSEPQPIYSTYLESDRTSTVNLRVEKKDRFSYGMTGLFSSYSLVLSNNMVVNVSAEEFHEYVEKEYYDFEILETTVVTNRMKTKHSE